MTQQEAIKDFAKDAGITNDILAFFSNNYLKQKLEIKYVVHMNLYVLTLHETVRNRFAVYIGEDLESLVKVT